MNTQIQSLKDGNRQLMLVCDNIDSYISHIEHKLKEMGVVLGTSVTSKTFLVITPEPNSDSSKVVNAKKLNILILTPKQFKQNYILECPNGFFI